MPPLGPFGKRGNRGVRFLVDLVVVMMNGEDTVFKDFGSDSAREGPMLYRENRDFRRAFIRRYRQVLRGFLGERLPQAPRRNRLDRQNDSVRLAR